MIAEDSDTFARRRRRVAALLAAGLVVAFGTVGVTKSDESDVEYATASFSAGQLNLEGSRDGISFNEHSSSAAAASLSFSAPENNLAPGDVSYAAFALRLGAGSTGRATVGVTWSSSGDVEGLRFLVFRTSGPTCDDSAIGIDVLGSSEGRIGGSFALTAADSADVAGPVEHLCIKVAATNKLRQGSSGKFHWSFQAVAS